MKKKLNGRGRGFTLIELMIVVAIIGILAMIAIPRFALLLEKAREGATKGNISAIRGASKIYYSDWDSKWPTTLDDNEDYAFSRYIDVFPEVKVSQPQGTDISPEGKTVTYITKFAEPTGFGVGWAYDSSTGNVYVNSLGLDTRNEPYTVY